MVGIRERFMKSIIPILSVLLLAKLFMFRSFVLHDFTLKSIAADISIVCLLLALPVLVFGQRTITKILQHIVIIVTSIIWFAATIYYSYYGSVPTYRTLSHLNQVGQIRQSILASIEGYMLLFVADFAVALLLLLVLPRKGRKVQAYQIAWHKKTHRNARLRSGIVVLLTAVITVISLIDSRSIENSHALAKRLGMLGFQIAVAAEPQEQHIEQLNDQQREQLIDEIGGKLSGSIVHAPVMLHGVAEGKNLIVLQVEAMQNFLIHLVVNGQEVTPHLNDLIEDSFYFPNLYQQIAEGNTSDAEYIFNTSAYPSAAAATSEQLTGKAANSLPKLLDLLGYEAYTFHANDVTFWNRNEMYPALGFTQYYDKPYFVNDKFNYYGASDKQLFEFAQTILLAKHRQQQPFYAQLIMVSSHHPFVIPEQFRTLNLPAELDNTQLGHYLQAMHYVDEQIGLFVEQLTKEKLLDDSVLVIYGDHFGLQSKDNDPKWVSEQLGIAYHDPISRMNIPFIISVPEVEGVTIDQVGGQLDMLPTVLNLMGIEPDPQQLLMFGNDLINIQSNTVGVRYYLPTGSFFNDEVLFVPGQGFNDGQAISLHDYKAVELSPELEQDYSYIVELLKWSDLYTTNYPNRP